MMRKILSVFLTIAVFVSAGEFLEKQLKYPRVRIAKAEKEALLKELFEEKGIPYPPAALFIRVFKFERSLELWVLDKREGKFKFLKNYPVCAMSGTLGPKRREGDLQVPEGFYYIDRFNPNSHFFLSLGINYPNPSDKILGNRFNPGSNIFIHGGCASRGCIAIRNEGIKEVYWLAVLARDAGQSRIQVHIFPCRLIRANLFLLKFLAYFPFYWLPYKVLTGNNHPYSRRELYNFWINLKIGFDYFEKHRRLPHVMILKNGGYAFY